MDTNPEFSGVVKAADTYAPRFAQNASPDDFDIVLTVEVDESGCKHNADIYLEVSKRYGAGNNSQRTQAEITFDTLAAIGYSGGCDASRVDELVGANVRVVRKDTERNGRTYTNWYLVTGRRAQKIDRKAAAAAWAKMMGSQPAAPADNGANPFA